MKEISEALSEVIVNVCNKLISKAKFDKTYKCRVVKKLSDNQYVVVKDNVEHIVASMFEHNENDIVTVLLPQNNWIHATIVYPQNFKSTFTKLDNDIQYILNSMRIQDTRNDDNNPLWYIQNHPKRMMLEFKSCAKIGLNPKYLYEYTPTITIVPWGDLSGGYPRQIAWTETTMYHRVGTSDTTWSDWAAL